VHPAYHNSHSRFAFPCAVMFKPPTVLSQGDNTGDDSLLDAAKRYLVHSQNKPGDAFLGTCCLDFLYDIALTGSSAISRPQAWCTDWTAHALA